MKAPSAENKGYFCSKPRPNQSTPSHLRETHPIAHLLAVLAHPIAAAITSRYDLGGVANPGVTALGSQNVTRQQQHRTAAEQVNDMSCECCSACQWGRIDRASGLIKYSTLTR